MRRAPVTLVLVVALGVLCCRAPVRPYVCDIETGAAVDIHGMWTCNRDVLRRASRGKPFSIRELRSASGFFEELTGLEIDTRASHLGALPGKDLARNLEDLDAWYALHADRLRWDAARGRIVLEGLAPLPGPV